MGIMAQKELFLQGKFTVNVVVFSDSARRFICVRVHGSVMSFPSLNLWPPINCLLDILPLKKKCKICFFDSLLNLLYKDFRSSLWTKILTQLITWSNVSDLVRVPMFKEVFLDRLSLQKFDASKVSEKASGLFYGLLIPPKANKPYR